MALMAKGHDNTAEPRALAVHSRSRPLSTDPTCSWSHRRPIPLNGRPAHAALRNRQSVRHPRLVRRLKPAARCVLYAAHCTLSCSACCTLHVERYVLHIARCVCCMLPDARSMSPDAQEGGPSHLHDLASAVASHLRRPPRAEAAVAAAVSVDRPSRYSHPTASAGESECRTRHLRSYTAASSAQSTTAPTPPTQQSNERHGRLAFESGASRGTPRTSGRGAARRTVERKSARVISDSSFADSARNSSRSRPASSHACNHAAAAALAVPPSQLFLRRPAVHFAC